MASSTDERLHPARPRNLQTDFTYPLEPAPGPTFASLLTPSQPLPPPQPSVPYSAAFLPVAPAIELPSTPLPNPEDIPTSPAWNPSSQTPRHGDDGNYIFDSKSVCTDTFVAAPPPYWLRDGCFTMMRLSFRLINTRPNFHDGKYENQRGEFKAVVGDLVKVQLGFAVVEVPFVYLIPERPECKGQVVTVFDGPHKGAQFRIQRFGEDFCGCSNLKSTALRRKIDAEIPTNQLVVTWGR